MQAMTETWRVWVIGPNEFFSYEGDPPDIGDVIEVTNGQEVMTVRVDWVDLDAKTHQIEASEAAAA